MSCNSIGTCTLMQQQLEHLMTKYFNNARDTIGRMADVKARLALKDGTGPVFMKALTAKGGD